MNRILLTITAIALIIVGIIWAARPTANDGTASISVNYGGTLKAENMNLDFGTISMAAGTVSRPVKIKNDGTEMMMLGKMYTSCMCTKATLAVGDKKYGPYGMPGHGVLPRINRELAPGEEASVDIQFDPAAHGPAGVGQIQRSITIENSGGQPLQIEFTAFVVP